MRCFVTGTDTDVGKTYFSVSLLKTWMSQGYSAAGFKPVSSGSREDAMQMQSALLGGLAMDEINPEHFSAPLSPWIAARQERRHLEVSALAERIRLSASRFSHVLVEGVGGWLTPLNDHETVADLARILGFPVVVVARVSLGTLNHTLLTLQGIRLTGLPVAGVIVSGARVAADDPSVRSNPAALAERTQLPVLYLPFQGSLPSPLPPWLE